MRFAEGSLEFGVVVEDVSFVSKVMEFGNLNRSIGYGCLAFVSWMGDPHLRVCCDGDCAVVRTDEYNVF